MAVKKNQKKVEKKEKKHLFKTIMTYFFLTCILLGFIGLGVFAGYVSGVISKVDPIPLSMLDIHKEQTTDILNTNGKIVSSLAGMDNIDRKVVTIDKIPEHVQKAFVAIEDERFYDHNGFDLIGFGRAVIKKFTQIGNREGGSTITMQLVKNITGKDDYKLERKFQEIYLAMELEKTINKDRVIELYLNKILMGGNTYGVQSASKRYFGKPVWKLDIAEAACLAAIPKSPNYYNPVSKDGQKINLERQKLVLAAMLKNKFITQDEYDKAVKQKVKFADPKDYKGPTSTTIRSYFVDYTATEVYNDLIKSGYTKEGALSMVYGGGLKIHSTLESSVQKQMNKVFNSSSYFPNSVIDGKKVQGAMIIIDPANGQIRAMYGGNGKKTGNLVLNRATQIKRQPGSTFKPVSVYGPGIDTNNLNAGSVIDDAPTYLNSQTPTKPYPVNASRTYAGLTPLREGIRRSVNVVAAKCYMKLGPEIPLEYLKRAGIERDQKNVALSMGGLEEGVSPLDMAAAYAPFANQGVYYSPSSYTKVYDSMGNLVLDKTTDAAVKPVKNQVYKEQTAYIMTEMLEDVCKYGTAAGYGRIQGGRISSAGKTGTTNGTKDKWFVGYTPYYVGSVWYGYDISKSFTDYSQALKIWKAVMDPIHAKLESKKFKKPSGIVTQTLCQYSGKLATSLCSQDTRSTRTPLRKTYIIKGFEVAEKCDVHVKVNICKESKLLAGPGCPTVTKIRTKRTEPFKSKGTYPRDWSYEAPTRKCTKSHGVATDPDPIDPIESEGPVEILPPVIDPIVPDEEEPVSTEPPMEEIDPPEQIEELQ